MPGIDKCIGMLHHTHLVMHACFDFKISSVLTVTKLCYIAIKLNNKKTMKRQAAIGFDMHSYI